MTQNLDYYLHTDIHQLPIILQNGINYNYLKTSREYGNGFYLSNNPNISLSGKDIPIKIHLYNLNDIKIINSFDDYLLNSLFFAYGSNVISYYNTHGKIPRFGTKYVEPQLKNEPYNGLLINNENTLMLYNTTNIKSVQLYVPKNKI